MPFPTPWVKGIEKNLAAYCLTKLPPGWKLEIPMTDNLSTEPGRRKVARAIYEQLAKRQIEYAPALYHPNENQQLISTPQEILEARNQGTCLDLTLLYAGLCLAHQLLPMVIVLEGHAFAAVCLSETAADSLLLRGAADDVFAEGKGLAGISRRAAVEKLLERDYVPVECTGFAHWNTGQGVGPEGDGRTGGLFSFEAAVDAARKHFQGTRDFAFALDIEWVQRKLGAGVLESRERVTQIPPDAAEALLAIANSLPARSAGDIGYRAYRATVPTLTDPVEYPTIAAMVADLCEQSLVQRWPPPLEFVERLRIDDRVSGEISKALGDWTDKRAGRIRPATDARDVEQLRRNLHDQKRQTAAQSYSWLQVYLEPEMLGRTERKKQTQFRVELVLTTPLTEAPLVVQAGELAGNQELWTLDEIPALLDRFFATREHSSLIPELKRLVMEIVAPSEIILYGFDRWKRNNENTYGVFCPMVVRLSDRLAIPDATDQKSAEEYWERKWVAFRDKAEERTCKEMEWLDEAELDVIDMQNDDDLCCLGLASPMQAERTAALKKLRDAGIPIAMWRRGDAPEAGSAWKQSVVSLIEQKRLRELREAIQQVRRHKAVRADEKHAGNSLTLLWDDPDRRPLKYGEEGVFE